MVARLRPVILAMALRGGRQQVEVRLLQQPRQRPLRLLLWWAAMVALAAAADLLAEPEAYRT